MATGTASGGDGHLCEVLDVCLDRMRQGDSLDRCLRDHAGLAGQLEPLLRTAAIVAAARVSPPAMDLSAGRDRLLAAATARRATADAAQDLTAERLDLAIQTDGADAEGDAAVLACLNTARNVAAAVIVPPRAPTGLARGRDRLLAAAAVVRTASFEGVAVSAEVEALDRALAAPAAGQVIGQGESNGHVGQLAAIARRLAADVVTPPPPPSRLAPGRARLLAEGRHARRASRGGVLERLAAVSRPRNLVTRTSVLAACVAVLLFATVGGGVLVPATAAALPGDALYGVKLLGERVQLMLAFDPEQRDRLETAQSRARGAEVLALIQSGREAEIGEWRVLFAAFEDLTTSDRHPHGLLLVEVPGEDGALKHWKLIWDGATQFEPRGALSWLTDLKAGMALMVRVALAEGREPLVLAVQVIGEEPLQTATPGPGTPAATATLLASATTALTSTPTEDAGPAVTPSVDPGVQPLASETADPILTGKPERDRLRGVVEKRTSDSTWSVRDGLDTRGSVTGGRLVTVDVSRLPAETVAAVSEGDWIELVGRWLDRDQTAFEATGLDRHVATKDAPEKARCSVNAAVGFVTAYVPVLSLTLSDGTQYDLSGLGVQVSPAGLQTGSRVHIDYKDCGDGKRIATRVQLLDTPAETTLRGTVENTSAGRFDLVTRGGRYAVVYDGETAIAGAASVENGQAVQVRGWLEGDNLLHATEIRVREAAAGATPTEGFEPSVVPPATPGLAGLTPGPGAEPPPEEAAGERL